MSTQQTFEPEQTPSVPRPPIAPASSAAGPSSMAQVAAQERVSAKELASALAAIETRRTTSARYEAGTITVGEAVEQLNLDIAPSEVLTEILAQRQQGLDEIALKRKTRQRRMAATVFPLTFFAFLLAFGLLFSLRRGAFIEPPIPSAPFIPIVSDARPVAAFNPQTLRVRDTNPKTGEVVIRTLAEVENNRPIMVQSGDLLTQFPLNSKDDFVVNTQAASQVAEWTLIKHDGVPYLRGYIGAKMSPAALASGEVVVCNQPDNPGEIPIGPSPRPITIRLDTLLRGGTTDSVFDAGAAMGVPAPPAWQRIVLPKLVGDAHLWDR